MHYLQDTDRLAWALLVRVINFHDLTTAFGDQFFAALLVAREPTEVILYLNVLSSAALEALLFACFHLLLPWNLQNYQHCPFEAGFSEVLSDPIRETVRFLCAPTIIFLGLKRWGDSHNALEVAEVWHLLGKYFLAKVKEWQAEFKLRSSKERAGYRTCHLSSSSMLLTNSS